MRLDSFSARASNARAPSMVSIAPVAQLEGECLGKLVGGEAGAVTPSTATSASSPASPAWAATSEAIVASGKGDEERLADLEKELVKVLPSLPAAPAAAASAESETGAAKEEKLLRGMMAAGTVPTDTKSAAGVMWRHALVDHPELAREYKGVGKSYAAQRKFRLAWANKKLAEVTEEKVEEEGEQAEDVMGGQYLPMNVIWREEGKDAAAVVATLNYVNKCVQYQTEGKLVKGRPWIEFNQMTGRNEFLYIKKPCRDTFFSSKYMKKTATAPSLAPQQATAFIYSFFENIFQTFPFFVSIFFSKSFLKIMFTLFRGCFLKLFSNLLLKLFLKLF